MATISKATARLAAATCKRPPHDTRDDVRRHVARVMADVRHNAEDATADAALRIRRHPLASLGLPTCVGTVTGAMLGFGVGHFRRR
jgi:ElaB/YqjD/DUF883 family membrane-anchored ribosome-binding protein